MTKQSTIQSAARQYLEERRQLGFDLRIGGAQLMRFARFADARHHRGPLTLDLQLDWACEHVLRTSSITGARRLEIVRPFAAHYRQFEPLSVVPPKHCLGRAHRRLAPHIYTQVEIAELLRAAAELAPVTVLRPLTYQTLFGLIACTGLRLSEALNLADGDVNLGAARLTVRQTKFNKSRCLPLHASVVHALGEYRTARGRQFACVSTGRFFVSGTGSSLSTSIAQHAFETLRDRLGWVARGDHRNPRIHDLRHTFAVNYVTQWHERGLPIDQGMLWLCTYLGHTRISDTYWYLTGTPELLSIVAARFEQFAEQRGEAHV